MSADCRICSGGGRWSVSCRQPHPLLILLQILSPKLCTQLEKHFSTRLLYMRRLSRTCILSTIAVIFLSSFGGDPGQLRRIHLS